MHFSISFRIFFGVSTFDADQKRFPIPSGLGNIEKLKRNTVNWQLCRKNKNKNVVFCGRMAAYAKQTRAVTIREYKKKIENNRLCRMK